MKISKGVEAKEIIKPPDRKLLENFLKGVLLDFSSCESLNGFYKQKEGLSMGGLVSPSFANIFVNILEQEIIKKTCQFRRYYLIS